MSEKAMNITVGGKDIDEAMNERASICINACAGLSNEEVGLLVGAVKMALANNASPLTMNLLNEAVKDAANKRAKPSGDAGGEG